MRRESVIDMLKVLRTAFMAIVVLGTGCTTKINVTRINSSSSVSKVDVSDLARLWWAEDASNQEVLRKHHLLSLMRKDPRSALAKLHECVLHYSQPNEIAALADLSLRYGEKLENTEPDQSLGLYLLSASVAYRHLMEQKGAALVIGENSRILKSYNQATARVVMLLQELPGGIRSNHFAVAGGTSFGVSVAETDHAATTLEYDSWLSADQWRQTGFKQHFRSEGLGARFVAFRTNHLASEFELHQPDEGIFHHATAVLDFEEAACPGEATQASFSFHNPVLTPEIERNSQRWHLAADYTMPWAMLVARTRTLGRTRLSALFHPAETSRPQRMYLMEPYSPDRIPIVMVHGLYSTPLAWQQLTNELMGDPEIRRRYQIWHYLYPTGFPFLTSAADFRGELEHVRKLYDPENDDLATQNMVVIGHSMGGLLARTLVTDSTDAIWNSMFAVPFSGLNTDNKHLHELRRRFYFRPKEYVKRAIFVAVPHRGSKTAEGIFARLIARQVHLPDSLHSSVSDLRSSVPGLLKPEASFLLDRGYPNSIQALSPKANGLMALAELPVDPTVPFHSIIGDRGRGNGAKSSDGWVAYASAHLPGANSELVIPANHGSYENVHAINEIKRILMLHLAPKVDNSVQRAAGSPRTEAFGQVYANE